MGGSAVSILRWKSGTSYLIESGKPFSLRNMMFQSAAAPEFKISLRAAGSSFPALRRCSCQGVLTGRRDHSRQGAANLPTGPLLDREPEEASGVVGPARPTPYRDFSSRVFRPAIGQLTCIMGWHPVLWVNRASENDPALTAAGASCGAFLFVGSVPDSLSRFLDSATTMGRMFCRERSLRKRRSCAASPKM